MSVKHIHTFNHVIVLAVLVSRLKSLEHNIIHKYTNATPNAKQITNDIASQ